MSLELTGKVTRLNEVQTFDSGFQKREMVITTEEQYPQPIAIDFLKDKIDLLNGLKLGDVVTVSINIGGREWTNPKGEVKYFNSITGWRITKAGVNDAGKDTYKAMGVEKKETPANVFEEDDSLPF